MTVFKHYNVPRCRKRTVFRGGFAESLRNVNSNYEIRHRVRLGGWTWVTTIEKPVGNVQTCSRRVWNVRKKKKIVLLFARRCRLFANVHVARQVFGSKKLKLFLNARQSCNGIDLLAYLSVIKGFSKEHVIVGRHLKIIGTHSN